MRYAADDGMRDVYFCGFNETGNFFTEDYDRKMSFESREQASGAIMALRHVSHFSYISISHDFDPDRGYVVVGSCLDDEHTGNAFEEAYWDGEKWKYSKKGAVVYKSLGEAAMVLAKVPVDESRTLAHALIRTVRKGWDRE